MTLDRDDLLKSIDDYLERYYPNSGINYEHAAGKLFEELKSRHGHSHRALTGEKAGRVGDGASKYKWICDAFNDMKTSTSERFLECLGIYDADVCKPLDELLPLSPAPDKESRP